VLSAAALALACPVSLTPQSISTFSLLRLLFVSFPFLSLLTQSIIPSPSLRLFPTPLTPSLPHRRSRRLRRRVSPTAAVVLPPEALGSASLLLGGGGVPGCWARARIWSCAGLREVLLVAPDTAGSRGRRPRLAVIRPDSAGRLDLGAGTSEFFSSSLPRRLAGGPLGAGERGRRRSSGADLVLSPPTAASAWPRPAPTGPPLRRRQIFAFLCLDNAHLQFGKPRTQNG